MPASLSEPLFTREQIAQRVGEIAAAVDRDFADSSRLCLLGVLKGSFVFLSDLARAIERETELDFLQAASYGASTESAGVVRLLRDIDLDIAGADVLLVEDIVDSGRTASLVMQVLSARKPRSLSMAALLDKPSRRVAEIPVRYRGFEIPDAFVVGYGMDYAERYRDLPDIRTLQGV